MLAILSPLSIPTYQVNFLARHRMLTLLFDICLAEFILTVVDNFAENFGGAMHLESYNKATLQASVLSSKIMIPQGSRFCK